MWCQVADRRKGFRHEYPASMRLGPGGLPGGTLPFDNDDHAWASLERNPAPGGHDEIDRRVTRAYEMFIEPAEYTFKAAGRDAVLLAPALVGLAWDMVTVATGPSPGAATTCSYSMTTAASCWITSTY